MRKKDDEKENTIKNSDCEMTLCNPRWIEKRVPDSYADDELKRMILFYVINTPCDNISASGISLSEYGWDGNQWRNDKLKNKLYSIAGLKKGKTLSFAKKLDKIAELCRKTDLGEDFYRNISKERIIVYKEKRNEFMSICFHIRNSFAHGRLAMYENDNKEIVFVMEDGIRKNTGFQVRARMVLKKSTLIRWIDILEKKEPL